VHASAMLQNHRDWKAPPTPCSEQGHLQQVAQDCVQLAS